MNSTVYYFNSSGFLDENDLTNIKDISNNMNCIFLNYEDGSHKLVEKLDQKYMDIIENWHNKCDLLVDIEETNIIIPSSISNEDKQQLFSHDIKCEHKEHFLTNYVPTFIDNIVSHQKLIAFNQHYVSKTVSKKAELNKPIEDKLEKMNIIIPTNLRNGPTCCVASSSVLHTKTFIDKYFWQEEKKDIGKDFTNMVHKIKTVNEQEQEQENNDNAEYDNDCNHIESYNVHDNTLYPSKFANALVLLDLIMKEEEEEEEKEKEQQKETETKKHIIIVLHSKSLQTLALINPTDDEKHIINNCSEYEFIKLFELETSNKNSINFLEKEFHKTCFDNKDRINETLLVASQYIDLSKKRDNNPFLNEEKLVRNFIHYKYIHTDNKDDKMTLDEICKIVILQTSICLKASEKPAFLKRLSKYLKKIGLKKMCIDKVFYYYGLKCRDAFSSAEKPISTATLEEDYLMFLEMIKKQNIMFSVVNYI